MGGRVDGSGVDCTRRAAAAVWLHGRAGRIAAAAGPVVATDIADALPAAIREARFGPSGADVVRRAAAVVDLGGHPRRTSARVRELAGDAAVMAVVKADAYGHGMIAGRPRAARRAGVEWLGVALPSEALALRADGDTGRILAWLWSPGDPDVAACVAAGSTCRCRAAWALAEVVDAAETGGRPGARAREGRHRAVAQRRPRSSQLAGLLERPLRAMAEGLVELGGDVVAPRRRATSRAHRPSSASVERYLERARAGARPWASRRGGAT